jgi:hypothetical protein
VAQLSAPLLGNCSKLVFKQQAVAKALTRQASPQQSNAKRRGHSQEFVYETNSDIAGLLFNPVDNGKKLINGMK